jgi:hypothetical protein
MYVLVCTMYVLVYGAKLETKFYTQKKADLFRST